MSRQRRRDTSPERALRSALNATSSPSATGGQDEGRGTERCKARIWPSWASREVTCGSVIRNGKCFAYDHPATDGQDEDGQRAAADTPAGDGTGELGELATSWDENAAEERRTLASPNVTPDEAISCPYIAQTWDQAAGELRAALRSPVPSSGHARPDREALIRAFMASPVVTRPLWAFGGGWHQPEHHEAERMADVALAALRQTSPAPEVAPQGDERRPPTPGGLEYAPEQIARIMAAGDLAVVRTALADYYRHGLGNDAVDEEHDAREVLAALRQTAPARDVVDRAVELVVDATDDGGQGPIATRHARAAVQALAEAGLIDGPATTETPAHGSVELIDHSGDAWVEISPDRWWCTDPNPALRDDVPWGNENLGASRAEVEALHGVAREVPLWQDEAAK